MSVGSPSVGVRLVDEPFLWAVERINSTLGTFEPLWGQVAEEYDSDESLWTFRGPEFILPSLDSVGIFLPSTFASGLWANLRVEVQEDYNYIVGGPDSLLSKWENITQRNPESGLAHLLNLVWVDQMVNTLVGTNSYHRLLAARRVPAVTLSLSCAAPCIILLVIWVLSFAGASGIMLSGLLKVSDIRNFVNNLSVGRLVLGRSALARVDGNGGDGKPTTSSDMMALLMILLLCDPDCSVEETNWSEEDGKVILVLRPPTKEGTTRSSSTERSQRNSSIGAGT